MNYQWQSARKKTEHDKETELARKRLQEQRRLRAIEDERRTRFSSDDSAHQMLANYAFWSAVSSSHDHSSSSHHSSHSSDSSSSYDSSPSYDSSSSSSDSGFSSSDCSAPDCG